MKHNAIQKCDKYMYMKLSDYAILHFLMNIEMRFPTLVMPKNTYATFRQRSLF